MLNEQRQTIQYPNLPAIPLDDPEQAARNLRAVAERMLRAAADLEAFTDSNLLRPYEIDSAGRHPAYREGVECIVLKRYVHYNESRI